MTQHSSGRHLVGSRGTWRQDCGCGRDDAHGWHFEHHQDHEGKRRQAHCDRHLHRRRRFGESGPALFTLPQRSVTEIPLYLLPHALFPCPKPYTLNPMPCTLFPVPRTRTHNPQQTLDCHAPSSAPAPLFRPPAHALTLSCAVTGSILLQGAHVDGNEEDLHRQEQPGGALPQWRYVNPKP